MLTINNTIEGYLKNVEIKGNTVQNPTNLADIKSVGKKIDNQELYEIPLLSVKGDGNLFDGVFANGSLGTSGEYADSTVKKYTPNYYKIEPNEYYYNNVDVICFYDKDKNFISRVIDNGGFTTPANCKYFRFRTHDNNSPRYDLSSYYVSKIRDNKKHESNKITILSPCQIEKVGDVADRIIEKNGVWGVEKNIYKHVVSSSDNVVTNDKLTNTTMVCIRRDSFKISSYVDGKILCNMGKRIDNTSTTYGKDNENSIAINADATYSFQIRISNNITDVKKHLIDNKCTFYIIDNNPKFIPLPHDQQILLKTFDNKTNISFLTEIEGTIKAQVPKSIKATVNTHTSQIENIYDELDRVKKLEESTVSTVSTDKDFANVQATTNGYFEDVKLQGKTLVNIARSNKKSIINNHMQNRLMPLNFSRVVSANTPITYVIKISNVIGDARLKLVNVLDDNTESYPAGAMANNISNTTLIYKRILDKNVKSGSIYFDMITEGSPASCDLEVVVLEGDYTQNPPSYFEGLKSVGDGVDEIVVSSVNENLFDKSSLCNGSINTSTGLDEPSDTQSRTGFLRLPKGTYVLNKDTKQWVMVQLYNSNGSFVKTLFNSNSNQAKFTIENSDMMIKLKFDYTLDIAINDNITLVRGDVAKSYTPHKADKKRILYLDPTDNTWKKPILREWDTIEKHSDGKYYYHQRSIGEVHNGSENYNKTIANEGFTRFVIARPNIKINGLIVSDKFISTKADISREGVYIHPTQSEIDFVISNSKLETQDVAGFKKWLQTNNVTVVYQLAQEKVFECTNIDLITYQNETNYVFSGGVISPRTSLKVQNNISNVVSTIQKKVSLMENYVTSMFRAVLAGDMRAVAQTLYPNDFTHESVPMEEIK